MPSPSITGTPVRLQVSTASAPPIPPIDANTGLPPAVWRSNSVSFQVGVFDVNGISVDLSNLAYLQLVIAASPTAPTNLFSMQVAAGAIVPMITQADWLSGAAQNATFAASAGAMDFTLLAALSQSYWIQVSGVTTGGALIVFGAGTINCYNAGSATPAPIASVVDFNAQTNATGNGTIAPMTNAHTEQLTITGSAGTRNFPIVPLSGLAAGARVWVAMVLPATVGITVNFLNLSLSGATLTSILTDGFSRSASLEFYFDGTNFNIESVALPAGY